MPSIAKTQEKEYLSLIRQILVYYPDAGALTMQRLLEKPTKERPQGLHLDRIYLTKLMDKIRKEREHRINHKTLTRVAELQDHFRVLAQEVRTIVSRQDIEPKDKGILLLKLFEKNLELFEAEQNAGIFERHLGEMIIHYKISQEQKILIINAFKNYGIIKRENNEISAGRSNSESDN